jgi:hypothetical protein
LNFLPILQQYLITSKFSPSQTKTQTLPSSFA